MGLIGRVKEFLGFSKGGEQLSETKIDPGSGATINAQHFCVPGIDAAPVVDDAAYYCNASGIEVVTGYADTKNAGEAQPGDVIIRGRDSSGNIVSRIKILNDGTIEIISDGDVTINGAVIDTGGNVTTASGISLDTHTHDYTLPLHPNGTGPTLPPS